MKRQTHIDALAGLMLLNMMLGHCIQVAGCTKIPLYHWMNVLSFFMPWFFYKSGMFYKGRSCKEILWGGGKLIKPYIVWNIIGYVPFVLTLIARKDYVWYHYCLQPFKGILLHGQYSGNSPLWFLPVLFLVQLCYAWIYQRRKLKYLMIPGVFAIGYFCWLIGFDTPRYIVSTMTGLFYYSMGNLLSNVQYKKPVFIVSGAVYLAFIFTKIPFVDINMNTLGSGSYLLWPVFAISAIVFFNNIFLYLDKGLAKVKVLHHIGTYSMNYYVSHWVVILFGNLIFHYWLGFEGVALLCGIVSICVVTLPIINAKLK